MNTKAFSLRIFPVILLLVLGGLAYSNTLRVPFYLDDNRIIKNNQLIRVASLDFKSLADTGFANVISSRPVANITYALNYHFHFLDLPGYHLVNIVLHLLTGVLLFLLVKRTLTLPALAYDAERATWIACAGALLWLLHPVQTQAVTYIVQRMTGLAAFFYLGSLCLYVEGRLAGKPKYVAALWGGSVLFWLLAMGSKENAVTLPFFVFLYEWYFFQGFDRGWLKKMAPYLGLVVVVGVLGILLFTHGDPVGWLLRGYRIRNFSLGERVLTEMRIVFYYLGLLLYPLPSRLGLEHDFALSHSLLSPLTTLFSGAGLVGMCGVGIATARRYKVFSFALFWFLGNLLLESSVVPLELVFEHRLYLPTMFIFPALVLALANIPHKILVGASLAVIIMLLGFWTIERNAQWGNPEGFIRQNIRLAPDNPRIYNDLGLLLLREGRVDEAIASAEEGIRVNRNYVPTHITLANGYVAKGWIQPATQVYQEVLRIAPDNVQALGNLGTMYATRNQPAEAVEYFERAVAVNANVDDVYFNLGLAYQSLGKLDQALAAFRKALMQNPQDTDAAQKIRELGANSGG
jgi:hypothetical protein